MKQNKHENEQTQFTNIISDGIDEEYSEELADQADIEAQTRAKAADQRAKGKSKSIRHLG